MKQGQTPLISQLSEIDSTQNHPSLKSFLRKAWQKSVNFAQNLIEFTTQHSKSQKSLMSQCSQSEVPKNQRTQFQQQNIKSRVISNEDIKSSYIEMNAFPNSHDLSSLFDPIQRKTTKYNNQDQRLRLPPKRRDYRVKFLVIPDQKGRLNLKEILKKLNDQKQEKIQRHSLKISRSQFKFFQPHSFDDKLEGKSLNDIFRPQKVQVNNTHQLKFQHQKDLKSSEKCLQKTPLKGSCQQIEQKMINQSSPRAPIVFRGDLSTILQSSNEDILSDTKVEIGSILSSQIMQKKQINQKQVSIIEKKDQKTSLQQKKINPFLVAIQNVNNEKSPFEKTKSNALQDMRMKLFNTTQMPNQVQNEVLLTSINTNTVFNKNDQFTPHNVLNPVASHDTNIIFDRKQKFKLVLPQFHQQDKVIKSNCYEESKILQVPYMKQTQIKTGFNKSQHSFLDRKQPFKFQATANPFNTYSARQTLHPLSQERKIPTFMPGFPNNANLGLTRLLEQNQRHKKMLNSFLQPSNRTSTNLNLSNQSLSLFGEKSELKVQGGEQKKTERKSRLQGKKRNRKEQRIRG